MKLPTRQDINIFNSLDEETAIKHYYNKTLKEIEDLYHEYSLTYCQDLMWMGPVAFNFYLQAVINYLQSDHATGDSDVVNCLASVIEYRQNEQEFLTSVNGVNKIISYIIDNYEKFNIDKIIYEDMLLKYKKLYNKLRSKK